jgi:RNase P/RNase MRP subunit POP5
VDSDQRAAKLLLFISGIIGAGVVLVQVVRAYVRRRRMYATIVVEPEFKEVSPVALHPVGTSGRMR